MLVAVEIPREIRQVRDALKREFSELIDMSDVQGPPDQQEQHFLSRALAALVVRRLLDCDSAAAAAAVVDGRNDTGIDAVAVADSGLRIWLIQTKWSDKGKASFNVADALKLVEGLRLIDEHRFDRFNARVQNHADRIKAAWDHPQCTVTLAVVMVGEGKLSEDIIHRLDDAKAAFNHFTNVLDYEVWGSTRVWEIIRDDYAEPSVEIVAKLDQWMHLAEPFEAYQGRVAASEVAVWYDNHGDRLFEQNIRKSLGLTRVNQELVETLTGRPEDFWYYNNGITVLCESAERRSWSKASYGPIELTLNGASVVNGAQTVAAVHAAMQSHAEAVTSAYISIKVVTTKNCPEDFGRAVTRATNTQNQVVPRDFVALDPTQWNIRQDFTLSLQKEYTFKRGEMDPPPDAGCSVTQAALALACAHSNPDITVRAKRNQDYLWEEGSAGGYAVLFKRATPSACQIWRSVQVLQLVRSCLSSGQNEREGRAQAIADDGDFIIAHLVFRQLGTEGIDDLDYDWSLELNKVPELTASALGWLIHHVDREFGPTSFISSTFTNLERCRILVGHVLNDMAVGAPVPEFPAAYRPSGTEHRQRRQNAVPTLVDAGRIAEGTTLFFEIKGQREREMVGQWLADDPRRGRASWVNQRSKPLLWAYDGQRYSPSGLVTKIWIESGWPDHPVAVQGPGQWNVPGEGSLWDLAKAIQDEHEQEEAETAE